MDQKVTFQIGQYNIYYLVQLSEDRLLNFVARLIDSRQDWIKNALLKDSVEEIRTCGHKIFVDHSDVLTIYEAGDCEEPGCCGDDLNKDPMTLSKAHLLELLDEWENFQDTKPEFLELSTVAGTHTFAWICLTEGPQS